MSSRDIFEIPARTSRCEFLSYDPADGGFHRCPREGEQIFASGGSYFEIETEDTVEKKKRGLSPEAIRRKTAYLCDEHRPFAAPLLTKEKDDGLFR